MADDFFEQLAAEAADMSSVPTEAGTAQLREMAQRMVALDTQVTLLEAQLKAANIELWDLRTSKMPELMGKLHTDSFGLPEAGVDLVEEPYYKANISADWDDDKREAGFAELDRVGGGDIVANTVTVSFPRGHDNERTEWIEKVRGLNLTFDPPEMTERRAVPWNTLTAFVKEQFQRRGNPHALDLEKLGATVGTIVKIKRRSSNG
jgi:hypothetical protein